jgi:hypothetical protein
MGKSKEKWRKVGKSGKKLPLQLWNFPKRTFLWTVLSGKKWKKWKSGEKWKKLIRSELSFFQNPKMFRNATFWPI